MITPFEAEPFSTWDIQQEKFVAISPDKTYEFYKLAEATKKAGFKAEALEYIFEGKLPAISTFGLDVDNGCRTLFEVIEWLPVWIDQVLP